MDLVEKLKMNSVLTDEEYMELLATDDGELRTKLFVTAQEALSQVFENKVYMQGVLEFTNHCPKNCLYCDLRAENTDQPRFRLNWEQIRGACQLGHDMGLRTFILQGGEDHYYTDMIMCNLLTNLKKFFPDCALTLALGERSKLSYNRMYKAGADRYLLRFQTADPLHFSKLHPPTDALSKKIDCINDVKDMGYELDTGFLVGAPYETPVYLARNLTLLQEISPHAISISPFLPKEGTAFRRHRKANLEIVLRLIAILRIMFPKANITAPWNIRRIHAEGQILAVLSGANVVRLPLTAAPEAGSIKTNHREELLHTLSFLYTNLKKHNYELTVGIGNSLLYKKK